MSETGTTSPNDFVFPRCGDDGLTKREYFAAMALNGMMSDSSIKGARWHEYSKASIKLADSLIEQLNK